MAWIQGDVWDVSITAEDKNGHKTRFSFNVDGSLMYTEAIVVVNALANAAQEISGAAFGTMVVGRGFYQDAPIEPTEQGEDKGLFVLKAATYPIQRVLMAVPGCPDEILQENLIDIDQTDEDVAAFIVAVMASVVTLAGEEVTAVERAYLSQRRSLKRPGRRAG